MYENYFSYTTVDQRDVKFYGAIPDTLKITAIKQPNENGEVIIPDEIKGIPVTLLASTGYYGPAITKLVIPKTLVAVVSYECFPQISSSLEIAADNPQWTTDGISLLSKDDMSVLSLASGQSAYRGYEYFKAQKVSQVEQVDEATYNLAIQKNKEYILGG